MASIMAALFGPTQRWVFVLVIGRKAARTDIEPSIDLLGPLPYRKLAVYSSLEKAVHDAAWEAAFEYRDLKDWPKGGFPTKEENDDWVPAREAEKRKGEAAKDAMLKPRSWQQYETTDGKTVWFYAGPTAFDYRIVRTRVDRWAELSD